jgi:hypothetical protein
MTTRVDWAAAAVETAAPASAHASHSVARLAICNHRPFKQPELLLELRSGCLVPGSLSRQLLLDSVNATGELVKALVRGLRGTSSRLGSLVRLVCRCFNLAKPGFEAVDPLVYRRDVLVDIFFGCAGTEAQAAGDGSTGKSDRFS